MIALKESQDNVTKVINPTVAMKHNFKYKGKESIDAHKLKILVHLTRPNEKLLPCGY